MCAQRINTFKMNQRGLASKTSKMTNTDTM